MQGRWGDGVSRETALDWLLESMQLLGEEAKKQEIVFLYEPLNRYESNLFNRQEDAFHWLQQNKIPNVKLLCDLFHMNIEEVSIGEALKKVGPLIGHVHFVDTNRQAVGFGHLNVSEVAAALKQCGYGGYLAAECLPLPDSMAAAQQTMASFKHWFSRD
jgi:sugar phosphate isomerase/epimerase